MQTTDVAIVGGGASGLAAAYELSRRGVPFVLLEARSRLGGVILTEEVDGVTIDAGPDSLLVQKPAAIDLCRELGLEAKLVPMLPPRTAYVVRGGSLHALPEASVLGIPTRLGPLLSGRLLSTVAKLRMALDLVLPRRHTPPGSDESIGSFFARRFGREAVDYIAEPLLAGIHAGDVDRLSMRALFPRLLEAEERHGSVIRALRSLRAPRPPDGVFRSLDGGLGQLVAALARAMPPNSIRYGVRIDRIEPARDRGPGAGGAPAAAATTGPPARQPRWGTSESASRGAAANGGSLEPPQSANARRGSSWGWGPTSGEECAPRAVSNAIGTSVWKLTTADGDSIEASRVILAVPSYASATLVGGLDAELSGLCRDIPYMSSATIVMAYPRSAVRHSLLGTGFVVPRVERQLTIMAASWVSSKWPNRAPSGQVALRAFVGGARDPRAIDREDDELVRQSERDLGAILGIEGRPSWARVYRWERANAQHEVGHLDRIRAIDERLARWPGLFVTGSAFRGVGIPDCVADGRATAAAVAGLREAVASPSARLGSSAL